MKASLLFVALCSTVFGQAPDVDNLHLRGTNLGGWLVLEPWITPSLFYQFEPMERPAIDQYHFCSVLGSQEGNRQLREHFETFVTEEDIAELASYGLNVLRIPVGYWMWDPEPAAPYEDCTNGSIEAFDRVLDWIELYDMKAIIDLHAAKDSQNGFDNSGWTRDAVWDGPGTYERVLNPRWADTEEVLEFTTEILESVARDYRDHPAVLGLNMVNEPWLTWDLLTLRKWYTNTYLRVKEIAPDWVIVFDASFRPEEWVGFFSQPIFRDSMIDTHIYHAFDDTLITSNYSHQLSTACDRADLIDFMEENERPTIVGEWSLATDDCCQFLLGYNQIPRAHILQDQGAPPCGVASCPESIGLPSPNPGIDGPDGLGNCPIDADAPDEFLQAFASSLLNSFERGHGWIFWNFKNELEPRWSYLEAVRRGWIPDDFSGDIPDVVVEACERVEDKLS